MPDLVRLRNLTNQRLLVAPVQREVAADGVLTVPPDVYEQYVWPPSTWRVESEAKAAKKKEL